MITDSDIYKVSGNTILIMSFSSLMMVFCVSSYFFIKISDDSYKIGVLTEKIGWLEDVAMDEKRLKDGTYQRKIVEGGEKR